MFTAAGQAHTLQVTPVDPNLPMRATVAWTDPQGKAVADDAAEEALAKPVLVNDLDLTLATASGSSYYGNQFRDGRSVRDGQPNRLDNVENVWLDRGEAATVTVSASALPGDGVPGSGTANDQDYALVLSNARVVATPSPGTAGPVKVAPQPVATARWGRKGSRTVLRALTLSPVVAGTRVELACTGRGCPRGTFRKTFAKAAARANLTRRLSGRKLARGARVRLRVTAPGLTARTFTWTVGRKPGRPAFRAR